MKQSNVKRRTAKELTSPLPALDIQHPTLDTEPFYESLDARHSTLDSMLAFFGTDTFSATALQALIEAGYKIGLVITKPDAPVGRQRLLTPPAVKTLAQSHNIPVAQPVRVLDLVDVLQDIYQAAIVVSFGKILPQPLLDVFPQGVVNVHASLLPKYRGASPIEAALLNGDHKTGVSLMKLDAGMDTGPVFAQAEYALKSRDDQSTLYPALATLGAQLLVDHLDAILAGKLQPLPQDETVASRVGMIRKADGIIAWSQSASQIERQVRAYNVWPGAKTTINGVETTLLKVQVVAGAGRPGQAFRTETGDLGLYCAQDTVIVQRLKPAGKRAMTGREFLAGHPLN